MMEALKDVDRKVAGAALSSAMLIALGLADSDGSAGGNQLTERILVEAREALGFDVNDNSHEALGAVRRVLSHEADLLIFRNQSRGDTLDRLGNRGDLPNSAFKIEAADSFDHKRLPFKHAQRAVREADDVYHFVSPSSDNRRQFSIFAKAIKKNTEIEYINLVMASREDQTVKIKKMWRILPRIVSVVDQSPLGLLRAFVDHYGLNVMLGAEIFSEKLILSRSIPIKRGADFLMVEPGEAQQFVLDMLVSVGEGMKSINIAYAYAIDEGRYNLDVFGR